MKIEAMTYHTRIVFASTARDLTDELLNQQINDVSLIVRTIRGEDAGLSKKEPAVRMWKGYEHALCIFGMFHSMEFGQSRGYADYEFWKLREMLEKIGGSYVPVPWMRDKDVMRSHRSNLARMYPDDYKDRWSDVISDLPFLWPFVDGDGGYDLYVSKSDQRLVYEGERSLPDRIARRVVNLDR